MKTRLFDYVLIPLVLILFAAFAVLTYFMGHQPEDDEDEN